MAWISYGVGILIDPAFGVKRGLGWTASVVPFTWLAVLWIGCGLAALIYAPLRRPGRDGHGFALIMIPPALWAMAYLLGIGTYTRGGFNAVVWVAVAGSTVIVAGMPEPRSAQRERDR
ncbi:hypothetical protein [Actinomadura sp. WMMA1423]|uniref:hypothetical protein n=1 Tax=Actinomadura sp. WMMA1423 TaxID=2591108 RepID=UPI0011472196|nr:hypothetical protein [Actinomadura sp. WMMA1423]